ncbi:hypothetical protein AYI68_g7329 [Smittium mucronatum]|uniref:Secreted protein n=1 Tax=Smittium mucronatum TaxID=133383 RepID=A0A1R0GP15_9FUNG|nr:hypothetical protein AYI68_g7329 [Smittium mucronatum]
MVSSEPVSSRLGNQFFFFLFLCSFLMSEASFDAASLLDVGILDNIPVSGELEAFSVLVPVKLILGGRVPPTVC